jgi:hypothetical protein
MPQNRRGLFFARMAQAPSALPQTTGVMVHVLLSVIPGRVVGRQLPT